MFPGSLTALVTPFHEDFSVDYDAFANLIEFQIEAGSDGIVVLGTTGEIMALTDEEKWKLVRLAIDRAKGRIPVIVNTGEASTAKSVANTKKAKEMGADGALVIVPYYVKPTETGIFLHFQELSRVGLPIILYHHPGRTGVRLCSITLAQIATLPNIAGIKDCSGDLSLAKELEVKCKSALHSGDDLLALDYLELGAEGACAVISNIIPQAWKCIVKNHDRDLFQRYVPLMEAIYTEINPVGIKFALSLMGKCRATMRLPLLEPSMKNCELIEAEMVKLRLITSDVVYSH